jgi:DNA-binding NarL/FixJ family response regulator
MAQPTRVLIADDSVRAREGLRALLAMRPELEVIGEVANGEEAVRLVGECHPDIVLMDLHMPKLDGVQATRLIKQQWPFVIVVVLTIYADEQANAFAAGADRVVIKGGDMDLLITALGVGVDIQ